MSRARYRRLALLVLLVGIAISSDPHRAHGQTPAEDGAVVYANRCAGCHGEQLRHNSGSPAFDLRRLRPDEHDRFVDSVIAGKDNMPSWYGLLKPEEIEAIWAYIRATVDR